MFPLALFRNPARVARRRTRTVDGADVRAVEGRPGSTAFSVHRGTSSLFVAGRRRNSLGRGGFRLTRTTPRGGAPRLARRRIRSRGASRARLARPPATMGAGPKASKAPTRAKVRRERHEGAVEGGGRRGIRGGGTHALFSRRARRTTLTLAPNRRERRRRAPERTARGRPRRSARSARKTRSTRYAERHEPLPRPRRVPNRVASPNPRRSRENRAHRAGPLGASCTRSAAFISPRVSTDSILRAPSVRRTLTTLAPNPRPRVASLRPPPLVLPPSPRRLRLRTLPRRARARCRSRTRRRPTRRRTRRPPQTNTADRARPPRDRRRRSSPPTRPRPRDRCDRPRDRGRDPRDPRDPRGPRSPPTPGGPPREDRPPPRRRRRPAAERRARAAFLLGRWAPPRRRARLSISRARAGR